jgi:hypothetical protein
MKKRLFLFGLLAGALTLVATAAAHPGRGHVKSHGHHGKTTKMGPYDVVTTDGGSCGNDWATDTEKRRFKVKLNRDGSYTVTRYDRGTFVTMAGQSPGACDTTGKHGSTVVAGNHGRFHGFLRGRVTGGTFNPNATCTADCGFTDVFIPTFFGPSAHFSCFEDSALCAFDFEYSAPHQHLKFHHWSDKGKGAESMLHERFHGDIANA